MKPLAIEPDALDRLVERMLYEITEEGDTTVLRDVMAGQVAIVGDLALKVDLLEAFVRAYDAHKDNWSIDHSLTWAGAEEAARTALDWIPQP